MDKKEKVWEVRLSVAITSRERGYGSGDDHLNVTEDFTISPKDFLAVLMILGDVKKLADKLRAENAAAPGPVPVNPETQNE